MICLPLSRLQLCSAALYSLSCSDTVAIARIPARWRKRREPGDFHHGLQ
jgi:hypothetical protein